MSESLFEQLAASQHDIWASWQGWVHENKMIPGVGGTNIVIRGQIICQDDVDRWQQQIETPYAELTEKEKDSDREHVRKFWPLIENHTKELQSGIRDALKRIEFDYSEDAIADVEVILKRLVLLS